MDASPSDRPYPKSALPSHFRNGNSQMPNGHSPPQTSVGVNELERLTASIHTLDKGRGPVDLNSLQEPQTTTQETHPSQIGHQSTESALNSTNLNVAPRDPRDKTSEPKGSNISRPAGPHILNPSIDFDGLSWPCELRRGVVFLRELRLKVLSRSWNEGTSRRHPGARDGTVGEAGRCNQNYFGMHW